MTIAAAFVAALWAGAGVASAQTQSEEAEGAQLLQSIQQGSESCSDLSDGDFELVGESWMGRMLGSSQAHEAMNQLMSSMMGSGGEEQMHEYMGRRVASCGGGTLPNSFGQMMGMMATMGGNQGSARYGGMMGGFDASQSSNDDDNGWSGHMDFDGGWWIVMAIGMVLFWALVIVGVVWLVRELGGPRQRARGHEDPLAILDRRFAEGGISPEEYRERRDALIRHPSGQSDSAV